LPLTVKLQPLPAASHQLLPLTLIKLGVTRKGFTQLPQRRPISLRDTRQVLKTFAAQEGAEGLPASLEIAEATIHLQLQRLLQE
jgi:hypothetical protein